MEALSRVIGDAGEDVGEPGLRVDAVQLDGSKNLPCDGLERSLALEGCGAAGWSGRRASSMSMSG